ncbi:M15 family metallopeptidase [Devosia sp. CN2-171]|uniref:M15 family metallopeptidase n=1 Tax=Devosia sp. CN2-171 TaxID=3400909 RepID=UPI003BF790F4
MAGPTLASSTVSGFGLDPEFAATLALVLADCRAAGYDFRISQGLRTPQTQADYYCRWAKRTPGQIDQKASELEAKGAPWVAGLLRARRSIKRQKAWLTNAMPGAGWHQWGLAADCYCHRNGKMVEAGDDPCYAFYASSAEQRGLRAGLYFSTPDAGHVQGPHESSAANAYAWSRIDSVMRSRFGDKPAMAVPAGL